MTYYEQLVLPGINLEEEKKSKKQYERSELPEIDNKNEEKKEQNEQINRRDINYNKEEKSKTYYELLNVFEDASKMEVKKAYFKLVKQYPPEKFPERFKEYRKAYEVLIDENARAQYDNLCKVPKEYKELYDSALQAMEYGDYEYAIKLLKEVVKDNPGLQILNSLLGDIYLENGNSGNGVKIFERLVELEPENASYHGKLAKAYSMRGYTKKAITRFEKSLTLDPDNIAYWIGLSSAYSDINNRDKAWEILDNGITKARENGLDSLDLHIYVSFCCIKDNRMDNLQEHKNSIIKAAENDPAIVEYIMDSFFSNFDRVKEWNEDFKLQYNILNLLYEIAPEYKNVALLKENCEKIYLYNEFKKDQDIPEELARLTGKLLDNCDCIPCKIEKILLEGELLYEPEPSRKALRYLRSKYPDYYTLNSEFYDKLLNTRLLQRLIEDNIKKVMRCQKKYPKEFHMLMNSQDDIDDYGNSKKLDKYDNFEVLDDNSSFLDDLDENETIVRTAPKIGRNEPCPCGSGKKYKRCCGAN